jgi:CO/xanthine dehydrogenase Mo-binding subunit
LITTEKNIMNDIASPSRFGSGRAVRRVEDEALLTGRGQFADDFDEPGQLRLAILRSPMPHARIRAIDTAGAGVMPGVVAVLHRSRSGGGRTETDAAIGGLQARRRIADRGAAAARVGHRHGPLRR